MSAKTQSTPARALLPSPIEKTPPSSTRKRALNELSINLPPRPHSAHDFTTPEHPNTNKRYRKVSEPLMLSASSLSSSASKRESPGEDPVWGPDVEAAFMSAIKSIPKLGRRKICIGSKPCGRNELIADFIYRRTGKIRTRKQVSSHIQVLKHIRRDDVDFLTLVADGKDDDVGDVSPKFSAIDMEKFGSADRNTMLEQEYQLSLPLEEEEHSPLGKAQRFKAQSQNLMRPQLDMEEFCIWATKADVGSAKTHVSHVYSRFEQTSPMSVVPIDAVADWALRFPCLPELVGDRYTSQCPVLHLRASLNLPDSLDLEGEQQVVLRTQLSMSSLPLRAREQLFCITRVYTLGNKVLELKQKVSVEQVAGNEAGERGQRLKIAVPFATDFWAAFLAGLASLDQSLQNLSPEDRAAKRERDSRNAVSGITVVQEIATMENSLEASRRLNVLIWEFNKTHPAEEGRTVVSRVGLPDLSAAAAAADRESTVEAPAMARSMSQPQTLPRRKISRPRLSANGVGLQRSISLAGVPNDSFYLTQPPVAHSRPIPVPMPYAPSHHQQPNHHHHQNHHHQQQQQQQLLQAPAMYCQPIFDHAQVPSRPVSTAPSVELPVAYAAPAQNPATYAMSRSYSAPSWAAGTAPTQYPSSIDTGVWNDNFIDWSLPESAGYLQSEFQVASDDFFSSGPSRTQSAAPQSYGMEHTTSTAGTDIDDADDARMPHLGFFPLSNF